MIATFLLAALAGASPPDAMLRPTVHVTGRDVRVRDLVVAPERLNPSVASLLVMRLPSDRPRQMFAAPTLAALVRRRVPGLRVLVAADQGAIAVSGEVPLSSGRQGRCFETRRIVAPGPVVADALRGVACREERPVPLRYDAAAHGAITDAVLPAGSYVGRLAPVERPQVGRGARLVLRASAGPVVIERQVTTLQPGRSGGRVFVRDGDGQAFAAPLRLVPEAER